MDGEKLVDLTDTCLQCLPCRQCLQSYLSSDNYNTKLQHSFLCCLSCSTDHAINTPIHQSSPLISLFISLKNEFKSNQRVLKLIDSLFLVECFVCARLCDNYEALVDHSRKCFASVMSQSLMYGIPYTSDTFFLSNYLRQKEEEDRKTHALQQVCIFIKNVKSLHPTNFNLSDGEVKSLSSLEKTYSISFSSVNETRERSEHFSPSLPLQPLSSSPNHLPPSPLPQSPLKRKKGEGKKKEKKSNFCFSDDERHLSSWNDHDDENYYSSDDNQDDIQITKIISPTDQSDSLFVRIKPENFDPEYEKNF